MKKLLFASAALSALSMPSLAHGQDAAGQAGAGNADIVVTATRRERRLQEVPLAVTALSGDTLRSRGIENLNDLGPGKIAGLTSYPLNGTETGVALQMRGYGTSDASQGTQDNAVAFYIDGINIPRAQGGALDLITPERIEVLRGPQGQLFGRNAKRAWCRSSPAAQAACWEGISAPASAISMPMNSRGGSTCRNSPDFVSSCRACTAKEAAISGT